MRIYEIAAWGLLVLPLVVSCGSGAAPPTVNSQVEEYVSHLAKPTSPQPTTAIVKVDFFARRDTLRAEGNILIGNWTPGSGSVACNSTNVQGLSLSVIDHIDELAPCPDGGVLIRAVLK